MNAVKSSDATRINMTARFAESDAENHEIGFGCEEWSEALLELICAAAINDNYCQLLLFDPETALTLGFNGQQFLITGHERILIQSIYATSLPEFTRKLKEQWDMVAQGETPEALREK